jgi:cytoskeletal protein CcmA (bactofilin family)
MNPLVKLARFLGVTALIMAVPLAADATVRREGNWPSPDKKVSFEFDGKPSEGLKHLADEAGWSLVMSKGIAMGESDVHINVENQPADAVLEALFAEGNVTARRNGTLVTITPGSQGDASSATPPPPPPPPATDTPPVPPPVPTVRGTDRNVMGASAVIEANEIVHTLTVTGGSAKVRGTVTGDLVVAGGSVKIEEGGRVVGNVSVMGGSVKLEKGARIDGDVGVVGGAIKREEGSFVGGQVNDKDHKPPKGQVKVTLDTDDGSVHAGDVPHGSRVGRAAHSFGNSVTKMALLFVLGCVFLALATRRMETLRVEIASRPMRTFALGLLGAAALLVVVVGVSLTIVGLPFAILGFLFAVLATYVSIASVLTTFGAAVLGHKTPNPYLHLLFGCGVFLLLGAIPYIGGIVTFVVTMIAIGALVSTRLGGLVSSSSRRPTSELV